MPRASTPGGEREPTVALRWPALERLQQEAEPLRRAAEAIQASSPRYTGVYLYALQGQELVLRAHAGRPTPHLRIPVGRGVCGRAVARGAHEVIADVASDPDYLACSAETRSECVVLVRRDDEVVGQIDIDSDLPHAFDQSDVLRLEAAARLIAPYF
ncbi:MAG TPA: GAF domain-containing protein [Candidatus Dormibacteraeota bacterium]|nr:GAF domain-containing protein [Candidatus Dormibacteraeota bacterium]